MCDGCKNGDAVKCGEDTCGDTSVVSQAQEDKAMVNRDKVFFLHSPCGKSVMTVACHVSEDQRKVFLGLAFASKRHFKRKEGRKVAFGRLEKGNGRFACTMPFNGRSSDAVVEFFNDLQVGSRKLKNDLKVCVELYDTQAAVENPAYRNQIADQYDRTMACYNEIPSAWRNLQMKNVDGAGITFQRYTDY